MSSEGNRRVWRRVIWIAIGAGVTVVALIAAVACTGPRRQRQTCRTRSARSPKWAAAAARLPLQALNTVWGLSEQRSFCTMCHDLRPHPGTSIEAATWAQQPAAFNGFGALYRDVLFQEVAPRYADLPTRRIYAVPMKKKKEAAGWPALRTRDSDGDGYSNEVELMFGSMPGRVDSRPWRPAAQLEGWRTIIARELRGRTSPNSCSRILGSARLAPIPMETGSPTCSKTSSVRTRTAATPRRWWLPVA